MNAIAFILSINTELNDPIPSAIVLAGKNLGLYESISGSLFYKPV